MRLQGPLTGKLSWQCRPEAYGLSDGSLRNEGLAMPSLRAQGTLGPQRSYIWRQPGAFRFRERMLSRLAEDRRVRSLCKANMLVTHNSLNQEDSGGA